jgi:hypothetical protein
VLYTMNENRFDECTRGSESIIWSQEISRIHPSIKYCLTMAADPASIGAAASRVLLRLIGASNDVPFKSVTGVEVDK